MTTQELDRSIGATADPTGAATFTFDYIPNTQIYVGTLDVPGAPDTAMFAATSGADVKGNFIGSNSWGPVQLGGGEQLIITATGLIPGDVYAANWQGAVFTEEDLPGPTWPQAYADSVTTSTERILLAGPLVVSGANDFQITVQPQWRSLWIAYTGAGLNPDIPDLVGNQSGVTYAAFKPPYINSANGYFNRFPLFGIDTNLSLNFNAAATIWYGADLADIDIAVYSDGKNGLEITNTRDDTEAGNFDPLGTFVAQGTRTYHNATLPVGLTTLGLNTDTNASIVFKNITKSSANSPGAGIIVEGNFFLGVARARMFDTGSAGTPINCYELDLNGLTFDQGEDCVLNNTTGAALDVTINYDIIKNNVNIS